MNCQQFESRLNELLDERSPLELDDGLRRHYRQCAGCRELWSAYGDLEQAMRFRSMPEPPPGLTSRIMAAVAKQSARPYAATAMSSERAARQSHWRLLVARGRLWRAAGVAIAATVLVAVCLRFQPEGGQSTLPGPELAEKPAPAAESRPLSDLAQDAARRYAGLAQETREDLSDVLALVPSVDPTAANLLWGDGGTRAAPEVASHVRDGLKPLAESTMSALTSLFGRPRRQEGEL